jgi:tetratricopeptide (TPR) repeat protein
MSMIPVIILFAIALLIVLYPIITKSNLQTSEAPTNSAAISDKLMAVAVKAIKERRVYRAEKALLTLLKIDEKNATAYNRLGILYAKQKQYKEAIECFEIGSGIEPNAASLHNAGLIYYELEKYEQAALMFAQSIELEGDAIVHYTALAKTELKLGNRLKAIESLEAAYDISPSIALLKSIQQIYASAEETEAVATLDQRIATLEQQLSAKATPKPRRASPTRRTSTTRRSPSIRAAARKIARRKPPKKIS